MPSAECRERPVAMTRRTPCSPSPSKACEILGRNAAPTQQGAVQVGDEDSSVGRHVHISSKLLMDTGAFRLGSTRSRKTPFAFRKIVAEGGPDGHGHELHGPVQGQRQGIPLQKRSAYHAGENISSPGITCRDVRASHLPVAAGHAVVGHHGRSTAEVFGHAGDDDAARAEVREGPGPFFDFFGTHGSWHGRFAQEQPRLGDVRRDDVGRGDKAAHALDHVRVHGVVELAVVAKDGVNDHQGPVVAKVADEVPHHVELFGRAEKAGIDPGKGQGQASPVGDDQAHVFGQVAEVKVVEKPPVWVERMAVGRLQTWMPMAERMGITAESDPPPNPERS